MYETGDPGMDDKGQLPAGQRYQFEGAGICIRPECGNRAESDLPTDPGSAGPEKIGRGDSRATQGQHFQKEEIVGEGDENKKSAKEKYLCK